MSASTTPYPRKRIWGRRHREGLEAMLDVLRVAVGGARKSHIMLLANLNSVKAGRIIGWLSACGLLRPQEDGEGPVYHTTEKGLLALHLYDELTSLMQKEAKPLEAAMQRREPSRFSR